MIKHFFRKSHRSNSTKLLTRQRRFTHERLESRLMMTINPAEADFPISDVVNGYQATDEIISSVAVSQSAGTLVAFSGKGVGIRDSVFLRKFDSAGASQDVVVASSSTRGERSEAVVAANDSGNAVVVWHGRGNGDKYGIFMQVFSTTGEKVGGEVLVNETIGGTQHDPAVAMAANGNFVIAWSGPSVADSAGIYARRYSTDGTPLSDETLVNTTTADYQTEPAIGMNGSGAYVITWTSRNQDGDKLGVFAQRFNSAGEAQGDEFQINTTTESGQQESSVAMQADGTFMAVWSSFGQDGDNWAVVGQLFDSSGNAVRDEIVINTTTVENQRHAKVAAANGSYLVAWQSGVQDNSGWEVMSQEFNASGDRIGSELKVNTSPAGTNSGHQQRPAVALSASGAGAVVWSGQGVSSRPGVYGRNFSDGSEIEDNLTPDLAVIPDQTVLPTETLEVVVTATDPNAGDLLTFQLDPSVSPEDATITPNADDPRTATIRWTPAAEVTGTTVRFRVIVTDNGTTGGLLDPLSDAEEFDVEVTDGRVRIDLNGREVLGTDSSAQFAIGLGPASITTDNLFISNATNGMISRATVVLTETPNGTQEALAVDADTANTGITATYTPALRRLFLSGASSAENYERVLKTLTYDNTGATTAGTRTVEFQVNSLGGSLSQKALLTVEIVTAEDLVGFAGELNAANARFFGASWSAATAEQKALFDDGGQFLPFIEVTNADRTLNTNITTPNNITDAEVPVWIFSDGTRLEGVQTLETLAAQLGTTVPLSAGPTFVEVPNQTLLIGSPLHVSLDGYDPTGEPLKYTVSTNRPDAVEARILEGNRSARVSVEGYGDMVFELFEQRASRPTERFIDLATSDFYDDVIFHRVINDFVIQGGDPDGTGRGGTGIDFDDQFHVDLQHNRTGLLSYAKSLEDTNDSQFFVTEGASASLRNLDFNHSIFGVLVEGEDTRAAISDTSVVRPAQTVPQGDRRGDRPGVPQVGNEDPVEFDITMSNVEIFEDTENAVLFLKANSNAVVGEVIEVTVTVEDASGNTFDQTFEVTLAADTANGRPFLDDINSPVTIERGTSAVIDLAASDVEGDAFVFGARLPRITNSDGSFTEIPQPAFDFTVDAATGRVEVTPTADFVGTLQLQVQVAPAGLNDPINVSDSAVDRQLITIEVVEAL